MPWPLYLLPSPPRGVCALEEGKDELGLQLKEGQDKEEVKVKMWCSPSRLWWWLTLHLSSARASQTQLVQKPAYTSPELGSTWVRFLLTEVIKLCWFGFPVNYTYRQGFNCKSFNWEVMSQWGLIWPFYLKIQPSSCPTKTMLYS